jgi:long-chain acyl-CoA synthetase
VQLQTELEQRLGISIADEEFERFATLGQLRAHLGLETAAQTPSSAQNDHAHAVEADLQPQLTREPARFIYPRWIWRPAIQAIRVLFQESVMRPLIWLLAAPAVSRPGKISSAQPLLLIANHVTAYDAPLLLYALPATMRRRVAIAMSGEVLEDLRHGRNQENWFLNLLAPFAYCLITVLFNVFPLPRGAGFRRSFAHAGEAMDRGYNVLVFPEGRRSSDGTLQPFRAGIGLLARESTATILPVALKGIGELKQTKARWFRSGRLEIFIGEPITPDTQVAPEVLAQSLHDALAVLLQRGE